MPATPVTPTTILTGFLGTGKSTLLNRLLRDPRFADSGAGERMGRRAGRPCARARLSGNVIVLVGA